MSGHQAQAAGPSAAGGAAVLPGSAGPATMGFARLGVPDVAAAVEFFTRAAALTAVHGDDTGAALATHDGRVTLLLVSGGPTGLRRLGYDVTDAGQLADFESRLRAHGVATRREAVPFVGDEGLTFTDPDGYELSLVVRPPVPPPPRGERPVVVERILHPLIGVAHLPTSLAFYRDVLGFAVSDYIADQTVFMRCQDAFHHSFALTQAGGGSVGLDHICFHIPDFDTLMRARLRLRRLGGVECSDVFRHGGSESITFYFHDPHSGIQIEFCTQHRRVTDPDHQPRVLPAARSTFDLWENFDDRP